MYSTPASGADAGGDANARHDLRFGKEAGVVCQRFTNKVAIITGSSRGIGSAIARALAEEGAAVVINHLADGAAAERVVGAIVADGGRARAYDADVGDRVQAEAMVARVMEWFGRLDILVNNAGICPFSDFFAITDEIWERTLRTNLYGPFVMGQAAAQPMREQGGGAIVNISSVSSYIGSATQVHYCATKGGVNGLTAAMAVALGPLGIRVNAVLPGGVHTDINRAQWEGKPETPPGLPIDRVGLPVDIARAVCYLASDDAAWVTGTLLPIDGGTTVTPRRVIREIT